MVSEENRVTVRRDLFALEFLEVSEKHGLEPRRARRRIARKAARRRWRAEKEVFLGRAK